MAGSGSPYAGSAGIDTRSWARHWSQGAWALVGIEALVGGELPQRRAEPGRRRDRIRGVGDRARSGDQDGGRVIAERRPEVLDPPSLRTHPGDEEDRAGHQLAQP